MKQSFAILGIGLLLSACRPPEPSGKIAEVSRVDVQANAGDIEIRLLPTRVQFQKQFNRNFYAYVTLFNREGSGWIQCKAVSDYAKNNSESELHQLGPKNFENGIVVMHFKHNDASVEFSFRGGASRLICPTKAAVSPTILVHFGYSPAIWMASDEDMDLLRIQPPPPSN
jgi:hypothetical protein